MVRQDSLDRINRVRETGGKIKVNEIDKQFIRKIKMQEKDFHGRIY